MPSPNSDIDQLRFSAIRSRMLDGVVHYFPSVYMEQSGAKTRAELRLKLMESALVMGLIDCCTYTALCIEEERKRVNR